MRLPLSSMLHKRLVATHDVCRGNARQTLEDMARRRREHEEVETFIHELQHEVARPDHAREGRAR